MAKSLTAPPQYVFVPRLELQPATTAVRAHAMILKEIDLNNFLTFFWTDSKITLQYINNESRRFKTYVANQVSEIRDASKPSRWRHRPGSLNPADGTSRGLSVHQLLSSERWFSSPACLSEPDEEWPQADFRPNKLHFQPRLNKVIIIIIIIIIIVISELPEHDLEVKRGKLQQLLVRYSSWTVLNKMVVLPAAEGEVKVVSIQDRHTKKYGGQNEPRAFIFFPITPHGETKCV